ncbi:MAG: response regulator [Deltaproteobacteria bacterium]|nr:response regulator [Deltaproteobacteria bacterium]
MEKEVSIAIIDDDAALASNLKDILEAEGYRVQAVNDGRAGMALFREKIFDLALVDIKLPEIPGPELVRRLSRLRPETEYIMITAYATMETAVEVIRQKQVIGYENKPIDMDHLLTFIREVMRRRRAEESQRISDANYHTIFDTANDAIFVHDFANGRIIDVNRKMCDMYGYTVEEARHIDVEVLSEGVPPYSQEEAMGWIQKAAEGSPQIFEWKARDKDGELFWVEVNLKRTTMGNEDRLLAIVRDINERKQTEKEKARLEAQLQQTQKMEVIATLAGGVAHEFNNALMGIMGNIELLKMELPEDERRAKYFKAMNESGHRMSRLTDQLLAYAQGGKYQARDLKLDDFIIETLPILQHDLSPEVRVETHFAKMSYIRADYAQMQMVLSAILANSNEAIEDEGLIRIAAENKDIDEDSLKQHPGLKPGPYVCLTIEDDGKGMDEETKDGIFEPFFTTKFQGRGMGMAAVYGIIKNHDGAIIVDSEPGKGTVVRIYLPAISVESKQEAKAVKQPETEIAMGEGTILIIEDEETLVDLFREILERLGYRVLLARTGKEAVELAKTFDGQIDLALLDIKLPDMDGGRVYPLIMEARPDLKVIVCSGYSIHGPAQDILDAGAEGFIQKPFLIRPFAEKLKEVLDAG